MTKVRILLICTRMMGKQLHFEFLCHMAVSLQLAALGHILLGVPGVANPRQCPDRHETDNRTRFLEFSEPLYL